MKTVGYLRLSREDSDDESISISNQRDILMRIVTIKLVMAISEFGSTLSKIKKLF